MATDTAARHDSALSYDVTAARTFVAELGPGARRDLLRVLTSSSEVRADVIRQFHERGNEEMAELLIELEEKEWARQAMIEELASGSIGQSHSERLRPVVLGPPIEKGRVQRG